MDRARAISLTFFTILVAAAVAQGQSGAAITPLPLDKITNQAELDRCDLQKFESFFVDNVEFYHDQGGVTLGKAALTESVRKNICGQTTRELVPGTMQVYYMKGYGALEVGVHRFHHPGHEDTIGVGEGKFIHLWQYKDGAWKITRVISYDHHAAAK